MITPNHTLLSRQMIDTIVTDIRELYAYHGLPEPEIRAESVILHEAGDAWGEIPVPDEPAFVVTITSPRVYQRPDELLLTKYAKERNQ